MWECEVKHLYANKCAQIGLVAKSLQARIEETLGLLAQAIYSRKFHEVVHWQSDCIFRMRIWLNFYCWLDLQLFEGAIEVCVWEWDKWVCVHARVCVWVRAVVCACGWVSVVIKQMTYGLSGIAINACTLIFSHSSEGLRQFCWSCCRSWLHYLTHYFFPVLLILEMPDNIELSIGLSLCHHPRLQWRCSFTL